MKGIQGLIVAVGLGIAGAILNFAYLHTPRRTPQASISSP